MSSDFARFYSTLAANGTYHVFQRDYMYTFHGSQATEISRVFFKGNQQGQSVVKAAHGMDETLTVSKKLLGDVVSSLIFERSERVQLWHQDESQRWVAAFEEASPGRYGGMEKFLGGFFGKQNEKEPVIAAVTNRKGGRVGVAVLNSVAATIKIYDFLDDGRSWTDTEACLHTNGVREVLVVASVGVGSKRKAEESHSSKVGATEYQGDFKQVFKKIGVAVTQIPGSSFKLNMSDAKGIFEDLTALSTAPILLEEINAMACGASSAAALVEYMGLRESKDSKPFSVSIEDIASKMQYDSSVSRALGIFNVGNAASQRKVSSYSVSEQANDGDSQKQEGSYADIEENIFGDIVTESSFQGGDITGVGRWQAHSSSCLLDILACTRTKMGGRLLKRWLQQPERSMIVIKRRQSLVSSFVAEAWCRSVLRDDVECLKRCPDVEKVCQKFRDKKSLEGVKLADLITLYRGIIRLKAITKQLKDLEKGGQGNDGDAMQTERAVYMLPVAEKSIKTLEKFLALVEELVDAAALSRKGGGEGSGEAVGWKRARLTGERWIQVRPTFTPEMGRVHGEMSKSLDQMDLERLRVVKATDLDQKAVHLEANSVQGIHFRVTKKDTSKATKKLGKDGFRMLSQQKAGSMFLTPQLSSIVSSYNQQKAHFQKMQDEVVQQAAVVAATYLHAIGDAAAVVAEVDCLSALAHVAVVNNWCCPEIKEGAPLELKELRHPIVEAHVGASNYVASDFSLSSVDAAPVETAGQKSTTMILTGPNMGGKSTYIRAVGLAVVLAHIGSYVPASSATVPLFDRVLTRVGANDSLSLGVSTFMSEMKDVSAILHKATKYSLVIIDELGRGTSTHEGFGIAWATLQQLASRGTLTLFATHFHELTEMSTQVGGIVNKHVDANVDASEDNKVTMLYEVRDGAASDSMGFAVARLASMPEEIVTVAESMSKSLEASR